MENTQQQQQLGDVLLRRTDPNQYYYTLVELVLPFCRCAPIWSYLWASPSLVILSLVLGGVAARR